eukprot:4590565-Prorocentrum_lima.AAC.1
MTGLTRHIHTSFSAQAAFQKACFTPLAANFAEREQVAAEALGERVSALLVGKMPAQDVRSQHGTVAAQ